MKHAFTKHIRPHLVVFLFVVPLSAQRPTPELHYDLQFLEAASGARDTLAAQRVARRADLEGQPVLPDFDDTEAIEVHLLADDADSAALVRDERRRRRVEPLAGPRLRAPQGQPALFLLGERAPVPAVRDSAPRGARAPKLSARDFGLRLSLTGWQLPDGRLHIRVNPQIQTVDFEQSQARDGFFIPAVSTSTIDTSIQVKPGQTFVVTGLFNDDQISKLNRVPELQSRQLYTKIAERRGRNDGRQLLLLVTPTLVPPETAPTRGR